MKIIVDAMGGDNAPLSNVRGAVAAVKEQGVEVILVGRGEDILRCLKDEGMDTLPAGLEIAHADQVVEMCDNPATAFKEKKDSSLTVGLNLLKEGKGDAFVSAGSTGALLSAATLMVKRIKGIRRAALAPVVPTGKGGAVLIDAGAGRINFVGNVEAREAVYGEVDVIVSDGYSGNIFLKTMEGTGGFLAKELKGMFKKSLITKLGALCVKDGLMKFKKLMDAGEVGGTALVGISKPVIKAHGSSNDYAIKNAIRQAAAFASSGIIEDIVENIDHMRLEKPSAQQEA